MPRIGVLGLEPFVVSQVDRLDRDTEAVVLDAVDDDARLDLDLDAVVISSDHAALPWWMSEHPEPPVVVVEDSIADDEDALEDGPIHLARPVSSPELRSAIDRSLGLPAWRRALRAITIEQDDSAVPDRWFAVLRTAAMLSVLGWGVSEFAEVGVAPLVVLVVYIVARALWWRLSPVLVVLDGLVAMAAVIVAGLPSGLDSAIIVSLLAAIALQTGFVLGWARGLGGVLAGLVVVAVGWLLVGRTADELWDLVTVGVLVVLSTAAGSMARRIWEDRSTSRSGELRRFRSALYELSRRQAVVAVSFDLGTVAEDALDRLLENAAPRAAMVLVADGAGPLQVAASHNLATPPPVRLTWHAGTGDGPRRADGDGRQPRTDTLVEQLDTQTDRLQGRVTIRGTHKGRLHEVMAQLIERLPPGEVIAQAAELDGELMGALVAVDPTSDASVVSQAEEAALAFDSVRLFNRLRAFTRDQERARIGRSLHDGVMQTLTHVAFELEQVAHDPHGASRSEALAQLRSLVLGTVDEMRSVVNDLRTVRLDRGLPAALEAMALTHSPAGGPAIEVEAAEQGALPGDVEEQFLRIAEEAVINAVRHAHARQVTVWLGRDEGALVLEVRDDGKGFGRARVGDLDGGVGLTSMYQRARSIGAALDVDTGLDGTAITVRHALARRTSRHPEPRAASATGSVTAGPRQRFWRRPR